MSSPEVPRVGSSIASRKYPTAWQRKMMWAAMTTLFVVFLVLVVGTVIWLAANAVGFLQPILIPVAIAIILSYLLDPLVTRLTQRGWGRVTSVLTLFAIALLALTAFFVWLVPMISMQTANAAKELPGYTQKARDFAVDAIYRYDQKFGMLGSPARGKSGATSGFVDWLLASPTPSPQPSVAQPPAVPDQTGAPAAEASPPVPTAAKLTIAERRRIQDWVQKQVPNIERQLPDLTSKLWKLTKNSIGGFLGVTGFLLSLVMVPIYLFFLLKERPAIERRWKEYLPLRPSPLKDEVATVLIQINNYVIAYFRGQLLVCLVDGLLIGTALTVMGLNFAPLIGVLVIFLTMIPYVGIVLCWIPAFLIAAAQWGDWTHPLIVTGIFFIIQNLEGMFYAPRIVGNSVGLHPMTVIVSIFVWGLLIGGLLGPILAVPLTATVKVLMARYVWGHRLRQRVTRNIEHVPVVRETEKNSPVSAKAR
ncbi:MAG: AI-2E family transporter [Verrucomicrobiota bacterium]|nr:AI-2E family transporter [Verrucomicrobiota bacterium]